MEKITLKPTDVYTFALGLAAADGSVEPIPAGDTFSVSSSLSEVVPGSIGQDADGAPTLIVNALTLPSPATASMVLTLSDSAGDTALELGVDYPEPVAPGNITANVAAATVTTQDAPTTPGP
jgi:hypothetical protein